MKADCGLAVAARGAISFFEPNLSVIRSIRYSPSVSRAQRLLTWRSNRGPLPRHLVQRLFSNFELASGLDGEQRERYRFANRLARRYCDFLERSFLAERRMVSLLRELRDFFRAPQRVRLARINAG